MTRLNRRGRPGVRRKLRSAGRGPRVVGEGPSAAPRGRNGARSRGIPARPRGEAIFEVLGSTWSARLIAYNKRFPRPHATAERKRELLLDAFRRLVVSAAPVAPVPGAGLAPGRGRR